MKLAIMPRQFSWWIWFVTTALLFLGLSGHRDGFAAALGLSLAQATYFWNRHRSPRAIAVQIRLGYAALLAIALLPSLRWIYWVPALGTTALLVFGYCLMARTLSLLPWNRREPLSGDLLCRTFFSPPRPGEAADRARACGEAGGVCELEARVAEFARLRS